MNQVELADHCSLIGLKYSGFNFWCISNVKCLFSETVSPKNNDQVCMDRKGYQDAFLVSFTKTPLSIVTYNQTGEKYLHCNQIHGSVLSQSFVRHLVFHTRGFLSLE